jgi:hypothetical protein
MDSKIKDQNARGNESDIKTFFIAKKLNEFMAEELTKYYFIENPKICVPCSKMFENKRRHKYHMKTTHSKLVPRYICDRC